MSSGIADTLAIFWSEFSKLAAAGRDVVRLLPRIIEFAAMRVRCGRTLTNGNPMREVLSAGRFREGYSVQGFPLSDREPAVREVLDALGDDVSPADQAVLNVDFDAWMATLEGQPLEVAQQLAAGLNQKDIADLRGVSRTRVWQIREKLRTEWEEFFGEEAS